jgi:flagellar basal body-associated protein FliL
MQDFTTKHKNSIIIIVVILFVAAGVLIWTLTKRPQSQKSEYATDAEKISLIESLGPIATSTDKQKQAFLKKSSVNSTTTASDEQKLEFLKNSNK